MRIIMAEIIPVLIGGDLNAYNIARAFHEAYGVVSHVIGRYPVSATKYSGIIIPHIVPDLDKKERLYSVLMNFADAHSGATLMLFGCTDEYVSMIIELAAEGRLSHFYHVPYTSLRCRDLFADKADFYAMCDKYSIPYPDTLVINGANELPPDLNAAGFCFPVVIKPSSSAAYWQHPFDGMRKVYFAKNQADAEKITSAIYNSGYDKRLIIQERIAGGDDGMRVLTTYSDKSGTVKMMCLGHVLLEEHTPRGIGNHSAIITEHNPKITGAFRMMLDGEGYTGFCNFDVKYDPKRDKYLAFDMNLRQGRSNYYVTASGINIAALTTDDLVIGDNLPYIENENETFWHYIPRRIVYKYTTNAPLVEQAKKLTRRGAESSSLRYGWDLLRYPLRLLCVLEMWRRQYKKYKENS